jgi:thiamine-phosphate pyrophosphorylase
VALLVEDRPELVAPTEIDGVHLSHAPAKLDALRKALGPERILGCGCGLSRHDAMVAGEAEADYVSFAGELEALLEIVGWWALLMTVPCVAEGVASPDQAAALAAAGADFILPAATLWSAPDPILALETLAAAIRPRS